MNKLIYIGIILATTLVSCDESVTPKPIGQMRIALPNHAYSPTDTDCPYFIEIPVYSRLRKKQSPEGSCWSDVLFGKMKAQIHLTYREVDGNLGEILEDTHELTFGHASMADNIIDEEIHNDSQDVHGTIYKVTGNVATNIQFYVTDSTSHFLRGALYFDASPKKDSLAPVIDHLHDDIKHMLGSLSWKE